jgi:hypothetical protein
LACAAESVCEAEAVVPPGVAAGAAVAALLTPVTEATLENEGAGATSREGSDHVW